MGSVTERIQAAGISDGGTTGLDSEERSMLRKFLKLAIDADASIAAKARERHSFEAAASMLEAAAHLFSANYPLTEVRPLFDRAESIFKARGV